MSSRQIKWLREQLRKKNNQAPPEVVEPADFHKPDQTGESPDYFALSPDSADDSAAPPPVPLPAPSPAAKRTKQSEPVDEEMEWAELAEMARERKEREEKAEIKAFPMSSLNLVRELKGLVGHTRFDECLKVPKGANNTLRFMSKLKKWGKSIPQYFKFVPAGGNDFRVEYSEYGSQQSQVFTALARINDADGILALGRTSHFCPPVLPIACQSLLFEREFDSATEIALRGFYVLQQALPTEFVPGVSKLVASPARQDFLELLAFLARFAFRRDCFQTCIALWKFGITLTDDDPCNFLLLAPVAALYAGDSAFVEEMIASEKTWREVPLRYVPDWPIVRALLKAPDELGDLSKEIALWGYAFDDLGVVCDYSPPEFLVSLGSIMRKRLAKYLARPEMDSVLEMAAVVAGDIDMSDEQAIAMSFWYGCCTDHVELGEMVEEMVMPTG